MKRAGAVGFVLMAIVVFYLCFTPFDSILHYNVYVTFCTNTGFGAGNVLFILRLVHKKEIGKTTLFRVLTNGSAIKESFTLEL